MVNGAKPGEMEAIRASEHVNKRNIDSCIRFSNDTRKMVRELAALQDTLQNHLINHLNQINELRDQLAKVQQTLYARGTVKEEDGDFS